jgi:isoleucyl-tRNA synthetase
LGSQHGLDVRCPVNGSGRYEAYVDESLPASLQLAGRSVLDKTVTTDILAALGDKLLNAAPYPHKYPVSWRSKAPVIYRTTEQWFIDLDKAIPQLEGQSVRQRSLDLIHKRNGNRGVNWVPEYGENRIGSMIAGRPDWCISRQRAWGVPITIMLDKASGEPLADPAVWAHIAALVEAEGIDAWDTRLGGKEAELFPAGWLQAHGKTPTDFTYVRDILDVWFDSGTTWSHVVKADSGKGQRFERTDSKRVADLYQEGSDQHRGWFHSSLLTSVALTGDAPYENVVTSGFVVDGQGRKFSKSLGNGVAPSDLLGKYGMDILRLWVASSDYSEDIRYSPTILEASAETYRSLRNTLRWLLGNLPESGGAITPVEPSAMPELEQYMRRRLGAVLMETRQHFDAFHFHQGLRVLQTFVSTELSNLYFDVRKDTLYCDPANSP